MVIPVSGWRLSPQDLKTIVNGLIDRIDAAALAPEHWNDVVGGLQAVLPDLRAGLEAWDTAIEHPLAMVSLGWGERVTQDYCDYFAAISPWLPTWPRLSELQPYLSDDVVPFSDLEKTEFYTDWLRPVGGAEHGTGLKLIGSEGRRAVLHLHYGTHRMQEHHAILSSILNRVGARMRGALLANRALALGTPPRPEGSLLASLLDPAFLLDQKCKLMAANGAGDALLNEETLLQVGARDAFHLRDPAQHKRLAAAVEVLCRTASSQEAGDLVVAGGGRSWALSLLPVAPNVLGLAVSPALTMFLPRAFALLVLRPAGAAAHPPPASGVIVMPPRMTPAERRFLEALCEGGSLAEIASRLGIAYETARVQLKGIYRKTGVHNQRDLLSLIIRGR